STLGPSIAPNPAHPNCERMLLGKRKLGTGAGGVGEFGRAESFGPAESGDVEFDPHPINASVRQIAVARITKLRGHFISNSPGVVLARSAARIWSGRRIARDCRLVVVSESSRGGFRDCSFNGNVRLPI